MSKTILQVTVELRPMFHANQEMIPRAEYSMDFLETLAIQNQVDILRIGVVGFWWNQVWPSIFRNPSFGSAVGLRLKKSQLLVYHTDFDENWCVQNSMLELSSEILTSRIGIWSPMQIWVFVFWYAVVHVISRMLYMYVKLNDAMGHHSGSYVWRWKCHSNKALTILESHNTQEIFKYCIP